MLRKLQKHIMRSKKLNTPYFNTKNNTIDLVKPCLFSSEAFRETFFWTWKTN